MTNVKNCNGGGTLSSTLVSSEFWTDYACNRAVNNNRHAELVSASPSEQIAQQACCHLTRRAVSTQKRGGNLNHV